MMGLASIFLRPLVTPVANDLHVKSTRAGNAWESLGSNKSVNSKSRRLNSSIDRDTTLSTSVLADSIAEFSSEEQTSEPSLSTVLLNFDNEFDPYGAISTPIYQTATFKQPSATKNGPYDYTRSGNPTRDALERLLAKLDRADRAFCFSSGMAALNAVSQLVGTGGEIIAGDDLYGGSDRLLSQVIPKSGVIVRQVNTSDLEEVASAVGPWTKLVWVENPTNPQIQIPDIRKIAEMAHAHGALLLVDNTMMSPVLCQPLELGADIVMHSATKFIGGHSAIIAGVLAVKCERLVKDLYLLQNAAGSGLAPFDCWPCLQGIKTMELRVEKQQENAQKIAEFLSSHPRVKKVNYAGLPDHPGHELHYSQANGAGSVLSFLQAQWHSQSMSLKLPNTLALLSVLGVIENLLAEFNLAAGMSEFWSVKSLISMPCFMTHAGVPATVREARGLTEDLVRISVGIENILIADLDQAISSGPL